MLLVLSFNACHSYSFNHIIAVTSVMNGNNNLFFTSPIIEPMSYPYPTVQQSTTSDALINNNAHATGILEPRENDCLVGRGGGTNYHIGNQKYRNLINQYKAEYSAAGRGDKSLIAMKVVRLWRAQDPPGRFLQQDDVTRVWFEVGDEKARNKTSQSLREKSKDEKRQSSEDADVIVAKGGASSGDGLSIPTIAMASINRHLPPLPPANPKTESDSDEDEAAEDAELKPAASKNKWSKEEDSRLRDLVGQHGAGRWTTIAENFEGRMARQCRERWVHHLRPGLKTEKWSEEEDAQLRTLHEQYGNHWHKIATALGGGRSDNAVKNRVNSWRRQSQRMQRNGNDFFDYSDSISEEEIASISGLLALRESPLTLPDFGLPETVQMTSIERKRKVSDDSLFQDSEENKRRCDRVDKLKWTKKDIARGLELAFASLGLSAYNGESTLLEEGFDYKAVTSLLGIIYTQFGVQFTAAIATETINGLADQIYSKLSGKSDGA
jgi:hypothetical protein